LGQDFPATLWFGLDWIHELIDWIGLGQQKWTHVQLMVQKQGGHNEHLM